MFKESDYLLLSLPTSCGSANSISQWLESNVNGGRVELHELKFPKFKVGTLDSLVLQSEELAKLDHQLHQSIGKVLETISTLMNTNFNLNNNNNNNTNNITNLLKLKIDGIDSIKYFEKFQWKQSRFRLDKSIDELIKLISNEGLQLDSDLRSQFQNYNNAKSNLLACQRKQNGDLSVKSLHDIVSKKNFVIGSDHLKTILLVVPLSLESQFLNSYETVSPFIVPRSAEKISNDSEYVLYGITLFKKYENQFLSAARENKWIPRDFQYSDEIIEQMKNEFNIAAKEESSLKNDLIRLSKEAFSEISICWSHIKLLRSFVESVLRYGLPPTFYCYLLKPDFTKNLKQAKQDCIERFGYLGGNAFTKDTKGKVVKDNSLHEYASLVDTEYEPFVIYETHIY
jgi:V-type H+-transporting ATPase subunit C